MSNFRLRVRCASPYTVPLIDFLTPESTVENLYQVLSSATEIPEHELKILSGYPPKVVKGYKWSQLEEVGIRNGDVLIVERRTSNDPMPYSEPPPKLEVQPSSKPSASNLTDQELSSVQIPNLAIGANNLPLNESNKSSNTHTPKKHRPNGFVTNPSSASTQDSSQSQASCKEIDGGASIKNVNKSVREYEDNSVLKASQHSTFGVKEVSKGILFEEGSSLGVLQKLEVPSDNSCLFTSIAYVLEGKINNLRAMELRREVAGAITTKPWLVADDVLDKPRQQYSEWILKPQSWGGEIELAILSNIYAIEIVTIDARTGRMNRFGESDQHDVRVFLLYDGIHYDPLHMRCPATHDKFYTAFAATATAVLQQASELAAEAHSSGSFTDTDSFRLRCGQCGLTLKGEAEALLHAKSTAHTAFEEVKSS